VPPFQYRVAQPDGTIIEGNIEADNEIMVRSQLESQGLFILNVEGEGSWFKGAPSLKQRGHLSLRDFLVFNQQFLALVKAGLPILKTFDVLTERTTHGNFQGALQQVREQIRGGAAISEAMAHQSSHFPDLYRATIQSGEHTGNLAEVLKRYVSYLKLVISVREKVLKAVWYPGFLIFIGGGVVAFLVAFVIPIFAEVYEQSDSELPLPTQILLDLIDQVWVWGPWFLLGMLATGLLTYMWIQKPRGKEQFDYFLLHIPFIGRIILNNQIIRITRTLATILAGGIPLLTALTITAKATTNKVISSGIAAATDHVRDGVGLAESLRQEHFLPRMSLEMIEVGETTGSLETMLQEIAEFHEGELDLQISQITTWIEPVLLLVMGVMVGGIVIIMYLPIFELAGTV